MSSSSSFGRTYRPNQSEATRRQIQLATLPVVLYLSDEWIKEANAAISVLEPTSEPFAVSYTVTDGPEGERSYTLDLGQPSIVAGATAPVGLRMTWDMAKAIALGEMSAQRAFLDGNMRIEGDAQALVGNTDGMAAVDAALTPLRATTTY